MSASAVVGLWLTTVAPAQEGQPPTTAVPQFGGPSSVGGQLNSDAETRMSWTRFESLDGALEPWFGWKDSVERDLGLSFGLNYTALYQAASDSPGEDKAAGGLFEFLGSWTAFGRESGDTGTLVYKLEHRHRLGTELSPFDLGFEAGSILPTAVKFNDFGLGVTNLYWQQRLADGRVTLVAGRVDPTDYLDVYGMINPLTSFTNFSFSTNPSIAVPNQGFGAAAGWMVTDNLYVAGGLTDVVGSPTTVGFDTFFEDREYFSHIEVGWTSGEDRIYLDNVHVTAWHADASEKFRTPEGWGTTVSGAWFLDDRWMPFLRAGYSEGDAALLQGVVSAGVGLYMPDHRDLLGLGLSWGNPSVEALRDQYTAELFYRWQVAQNLAITPDLQLVADPALNPDEDLLAFLGIRGRITF